MKLILKNLKADLKVLAAEIRSLKSKRKELKGNVPELLSTQMKFRSGHIAYCLLRGRTMEQIEPKLKDGMNYINYAVRKEAARIVESAMEATKNAPQP